MGKAVQGETQGPSRRGEAKVMQEKKFEVSVQGVVDLLNEALRMDEHGVSDLVDEKTKRVIQFRVREPWQGSMGPTAA